MFKYIQSDGEYNYYSGKIELHNDETPDSERFLVINIETMGGCPTTVTPKRRLY